MQECIAKVCTSTYIFVCKQVLYSGQRLSDAITQPTLTRSHKNPLISTYPGSAEELTSLKIEGDLDDLLLLGKGQKHKLSCAKILRLRLDVIKAYDLFMAAL